METLEIKLGGVVHEKVEQCLNRDDCKDCSLFNVCEDFESEQGLCEIDGVLRFGYAFKIKE